MQIAQLGDMRSGSITGPAAVVEIPIAIAVGTVNSPMVLTSG
jgi:hypothetical protein